ncbi:poly-beta-1,6-N-acetyl-D-glucosamine synthase [Thioalkalivibrio sulfidiphilus]|uniref:poly-beta-1,6-N-acetyl-D-glucosamine synthase n=1 Tax=Thioalkalivibrio sulfidiphilus TaxID=1033854 RepID=UPI003B31F224
MIPNTLMHFVFFYPLIMAWVWMIGGIVFYFHWERRNKRDPDHLPYTGRSAPCSIIIPCFNEAEVIRDTIHYAHSSEYPDFEVIAVNDGSTDSSAEILEQLTREYPRLRVVHLASNQGKAVALRTGALAAKHDFLICIDGDALLHPNAVAWMMHHLTSGPRVGAVTGNPRILNRSTLLGKLQVGEFSAIIGLIKRAQRIYGRIFTVSGVIAGFRRTALDRIGYWSSDMVTEDIDISWRLQLDHWDIRYEPNALCYIYMPETFKGLWRQRLRWAQGGVETVMRHGASLFHWRKRRLWGVALEYLTSVLWAYVMFAVILLALTGLVIDLPEGWVRPGLIPQWAGVILGLTALMQFLVSLMIDRRYEPDHRFFRNYFWVIWYPLAFWLLSMATTVAAVPIALIKRSGKRARWVSPDRGLRPPET